MKAQQAYEQGGFYNWLGNGKRCVAIHEAGHAIAAWLICVDMHVIAVMDESGYVAGEHVHETKYMGVVKHSIIHNHDLNRMRESKSGVVGCDGKIIPFIKYHADSIKRDAQRSAFVALAGPISEALYENDNVFNKKYSRPHRTDMDEVNEMLDLICAVDEQINRDDALNYLVEKTRLFMSMHWGKVEKIARVLERDYVIQGYKINSIVGINYIDVAAHDFDIGATEINLEVISPKNVLTSERNYNLNGITREQG